MVTPDQLRAMITALPFQPFVIKLASRESFTVRHPENVARDVRGRAMTVHDDEGMNLVEMLLVEVMEPVKSLAGPGTEGNGA